MSASDYDDFCARLRSVPVVGQAAADTILTLEKESAELRAENERLRAKIRVLHGRLGNYIDDERSS
jgi:cell division protein FtsB